MTKRLLAVLVTALIVAIATFTWPTVPVRGQYTPPNQSAGGVTSVTIAGTSSEINTAGTCTITTSGTCTFSLDPSQKVRTFGATFTNGGATVVPTQSAPFRIPYACTISSINISLAPSGTATLAVWKIATGTAIPTVANLISTAGIAISTGTVLQSSTVTDFTTTAVAKNDQAIISLTAVGGAPTSITYSVECDLP